MTNQVPPTPQTRVLVVEDEPTVAQIIAGARGALAQALEEQQGGQLVIA
jgi:hypothetical protein